MVGEHPDAGTGSGLEVVEVESEPEDGRNSRSVPDVGEGLNPCAGTGSGGSVEVGSVKVRGEGESTGSGYSGFPNGSLSGWENRREIVLELDARFGYAQSFERIEREVVVRIPYRSRSLRKDVQGFVCGVYGGEVGTCSGLDFRTYFSN